MMHIRRRSLFHSVSVYFTMGISLIQASPHLVENQSEKIAREKLNEAIKNPEYLLNNTIHLPISTHLNHQKQLRLSLRECILLALRYNPNIQNAELDRILQRYQLRLAHNEFELQYALGGTAMLTNSSYSGVGQASTHGYVVTPEFNLKNSWGTVANLNMRNNMAMNGNYNPLLNFSLTQPLLRGFGPTTNQRHLQDSLDEEYLNQLSLHQSIIDQITQIITVYRNVILSSNHLKIQKNQLQEAYALYEKDEQQIAAGELEPTATIQQSYQIESIKLMVEQAEQHFKTTRQDLLQMIGLDLNTPLSVPNDITLHHLYVPDVQQAIHRALEHNLNFLALKMTIRADKRAYQAAKNQQLWQLDLSATAQAGTITNVDNHTDGLHSIYSGNNLNETAAVTLTIPLEDLNRRQILIAAKVKLEKDRITYRATQQALIAMVKNIITTTESLVRRYDLANRQVELAEKSYSLEKKKLQAGISTPLDINNIQNQWIQAQIALIYAKIDYLNQLSMLHALLGTTLDEWKIKLG